jgi:hypothetical protein
MLKRRLSAFAAALLSSVLWSCGGSSPASPTTGGGGGGGGGNIPPPVTGPVQVLAAGDVGECGFGAAETGKLLESLPGTILALGDLAYYDGTKANFRDCYDPFWGQFQDRIRPVPGNHEYSDGKSSADGYWDYFGGLAGQRGSGYYAFPEGSWRIIALNSEISMRPGSPQLTWLRQELSTTRALCTLAYWHRPLFTSGPNGPNQDVRDLWLTLEEFGVDVVLNAHDHLYERFDKQDSAGRPSPTGIRQFTVGTGGAHSYDSRPPQPNSLRIAKAYGILQLTLSNGTYQWNFVTNSSFRDSDSGQCR